MIHLPELIQDLGFILITAALVTILFKKLKQPVVLGYLIAGILVGPHVPIIPTVQDTESVKVWAEIGVIVLLFGLGLEFNIKKLAQTGKSASITAIVEVIFMLMAGYLFGKVMGWSNLDSLFLGGILSVSSTTIIIRAFEELNLKSQKFVSLVFGVLIVEDIVAILLLVLLSTVAISKNLSGVDLAVSGLRLGFFLILWFVVGIFLLPTFLKKIKVYLNDETTLVISLGLCLLMVIIATYVGFSPALGAFVMGLLLAETKEGPRIEKLIHPIKDLFAAVFFVSVGMLIDPQVLLHHGPEILLITAITILGKLISSSIGAMLSGVSFRQSMQTGMSLSQIGEFSFIIATLGVSLKVTSDFLYPIAVSVSVLTTFTTPYLIKNSDKLSLFLEKKLPDRFFKALERYQEAVLSEQSESGFLSLLWKAYGWKTLLNGVLVLAIIGAGRYFTDNFGTSITFLTVCFLSSPFFWAFCLSQPSPRLTDAEISRLQKVGIGIFIARNALGFILAVYAVNSFIPLDSWKGILSLVILTLAVFLGGTKKGIYYRFETGFIKNLTQNNNPSKEDVAKSKLAPWNATLTTVTVPPQSKYVGLSLLNSKIKEDFSTTIALIERGDLKYLAPDRNFILMPYDKLYLIGSDDQVTQACTEIEKNLIPVSNTDSDVSYGLHSIKAKPHCDFVNKTIRESGIREKTSGLIVGIERAGERLINPDSALQIHLDDILWIVGDYDKIKALTHK
ncbi:MAG: cation:proton antiporter [Pseudobdellovibrio sp.]